MILCNIEIQAAIDSRRLTIFPEPLPRRPKENEYCPYDTHTVDLTLAPEISIPDSGTYAYDLMQSGSLATFISKNSTKHKIANVFSLKRHHFILGRTVERISLPIDPKLETCLAARVEGKSSRARCGVLVHFTAPTIHPGFEGTVTLEIINLGPVDFILRPGMPIAQLIIEEVKGIPFAKFSQFQGQTTPEGAK